MAIDPVCGMEVSEENTQHLLRHQDETYYFCCAGCKEAYGRQLGVIAPAKKKNWFERFLEKIAAANSSDFGGTPPKCH